MKHKVLKLILAITTIFPLQSCLPKREVKEWGFFKYIIKDGEVIITELVKEGRYETTLVVPSSIDGLPVVSFGHHTGAYGSGWVYSVSLQKLILMNNSIKIPRPINFQLPPATIVFVDAEPNFDEPWIIANYVEVCYSQPGLEALFKQALCDVCRFSVSAGNVFFYYDYDESPNNGFAFLNHQEKREKSSFHPIL